MENLESFMKEVKSLLLKKIENKELKISATRIRSANIFIFDNEQGKLRYYIDKDIVEKLSPELINQIETIWIRNLQS